ncbi:MAG: MBL fold metallo-hydrolase [Dermatophilaceae bacterium]
MPRSAFTEIADGVYVARYPQWDVNVGLVVGTAGALVIDTRSSAAAGAEVLRDVGRVADPSAVRHVVNTHVHFDHTFGNIAFAGCTIHAHDNVATALDAHAAWIKRAASADPGDAPEYGYTAADIADLLATPVRKPDATFTTSAVVDLGDRVALLRYAGRGHTDGDAAVLVPDSGVAFLGDLIEQPGPPSFGPDSWPLEWADTLEEHLTILAADVVLVPGHGTAVDRDYGDRQRAQIALVASVIRERRTAGMTLDEARQEPDARLPYPVGLLQDAFARGWQQPGV